MIIKYCAEGNFCLDDVELEVNDAVYIASEDDIKKAIINDLEARYGLNIDYQIEEED